MIQTEAKSSCEFWSEGKDRDFQLIDKNKTAKEKYNHSPFFQVIFKITSIYQCNISLHENYLQVVQILKDENP